MFNLGHYKVEVFDYKLNLYVATPPGLGMFVNVFDPEQKNLMSRVRIEIKIVTVQAEVYKI